MAAVIHFRLATVTVRGHYLKFGRWKITKPLILGFYFVLELLAPKRRSENVHLWLRTISRRIETSRFTRGKRRRLRGIARG